MKTIIPYEHDIKFKTKIAEITSISLEHEDSIKDTEIMGDFIISGDYKIHSISVNKEPFNYRLPFSVELADNLIRDSITYDVSDFTYDIKEPDILTVKIELTLNAEEVEVEDEHVNIIPKEVKDPVELDRELDNIIDTDNTVTTNNSNDLSKDVIMNNVTNSANTYITYNVHVVKDIDTIDTICSNYKISKDTLEEYNNIQDLKTGDKLIIPDSIDE